MTMCAKRRARLTGIEERVADAILRKLFERGLVVVTQPQNREGMTCVNETQGNGSMVRTRTTPNGDCDSNHLSEARDLIAAIRREKPR